MDDDERTKMKGFEEKIWQTRFLKKILDDDERTKMKRFGEKIWQTRFLKKILDDDEITKTLRRKDLADEIFEKNLG